MAELMKAMENQVIRDQVLELLREAGPNGANEKVVTMALHKAGYRTDAKQIQEALYYLQYKGLISAIQCENKSLSISMVVYMITPEGIDVLEGTTQAEGIGVG